MRDATVKGIVKLLPREIKRNLPVKILVVKASKENSLRLNKIYRGKTKPANVLSFRYGKEYGEIIVCAEIIKKEARIQKNSYRRQMTWMILHGILHLAGLHHEVSASKAKKTEGLEKEILQKLFSELCVVNCEL